MNCIKKLLLVLGVISNVHLHAQMAYPNLFDYTGADARNFVRTYVPQQPTNNPDDISLPNQNAFNCIVNTKYFDGLGRAMQEVSRSAFLIDGSTIYSDYVKVHTYDNTGKETYNYLPFSVAEASMGQRGKLKTNPTSQLSTQYSTLYPGEQPFSQTIWDNSPLNRPQVIMSPGSSWVGSSRGVNFSYGYPVGSSLPALMKFKVGPLNTDLPVQELDYDNGELYVTFQKDEDDHTVITYTDKDGKVVQKAELGAVAGSLATITCYVYDDFDRLRWVLTPSFFASGEIITSTLCAELFYRYFYDERGRLIERQFPGKATEYFVYDKHDRVILSQDGNNRKCASSGSLSTELGNSCSWNFSYFDVLDRVQMSGLYHPNDAISRGDLQTLINGISNGTATSTSPLLNTLATDNFNSYPSSFSDADIWNINYYDDYSNPELLSSTFDDSYNSQLTGISPYASLPQQSFQTRGLVTGSKTRIFDPNNIWSSLMPDYNYTTNWIKKINFYDEKARLIQTKANNHCNGNDILTNQYDFSNNLVCRVLKHNNPNAVAIAPGTASNFQNSNIVTSYSFERYSGKIKSETQNINSNGVIPIKTISYDVLGRISNNNQNVAANYLDYNIKGWLTGINANYFTYLSSPPSNIFFREKLFYDNLNIGSPYDGSNTPFDLITPLYNGNIAGITWQGYGVSSRIKAYAYKYDEHNRVTTSYFTRFNNLSDGWMNTIEDYTMSNVSYDFNGNLKTMNQMGPNTSGGPPVTIDQLTYHYLPNSNKLKGVKDDASIPTSNPDFKDDPGHSENDYAYDDNGNLISDLNKNILSISYSSLDKPEHVDANDKGVLTYVYDANGNKLQKIITSYYSPPGVIGGGGTTGGGTSTPTTKVIDYLGPFQYENNVLKNISHSEGRCRPSVDVSGALSYVYDYFLKDHLGNVRSIVTADAFTDITGATDGTPSTLAPVSPSPPLQTYLATHEIAVSNAEDAVFNNIELVREDKPASTDSSDVKAVTLCGIDSIKRVGTSMMLRVMPGDQFSVSVNSYFDAGSDSIACSYDDLVTSLLNTLAGGTDYTGVAVAELPQNVQVLQGTFNNPSFSTIYSDIISSTFDSTVPAAFLNYIVLDEQMNIVPGQSGAIQIGGVASAWNAIGTSSNIRIEQPGYVLAFLNSFALSPVSFDHLNFTYYRGNEIEENHYYPFGLCLQTASLDPALKNNIKYNSKELQHDEFYDASGNLFGLQWEDYGARMQDPQIGRWNGIDAKAEKYSSYSPYCYTVNDPIKYIDIDGKDPERPWYYKLYNQFFCNATSSHSLDIDCEREVNRKALTNYNAESYEGAKNMEEFSGFVPFGATVFYANCLILNEDPTGQRRSPLEFAKLGTTNLAIDLLGGEVLDLAKPAVKMILKPLLKEEHHLITVSIFKEGGEIIENAIKGGFNFESEANKIELTKFSRLTGEGVHGKHPVYTDYVRKQIDNFANQTKLNGEKITPQNAAKFFYEQSSDLRNEILSNPNKKINDLFK